MVNTPAKQTSHLKREIIARLIRAYLGNNYEEDVRMIPFEMRPKGSDAMFRCCLHKERAILRDRVIAGLGFDIEEVKDYELLSDLAKKAAQRQQPEENPLTLLQSACNECVPARIHVTDLCQGCVARPCESACKFGAIKVEGGKSVIDHTKCKSCGLCAQACPFQAITKIIVPCENACPVGAIAKDDDGLTRIDYDKCISCGKCVKACPFGAVHKKSQIIDIIKNIKSGKNVIAMLAPSLMGQLPCTPGQLKDAILKLGFSDVVEVALGADITTKNEAKEFVQRVIKGKSEFMTTSCCAGYNELVKKHIPEIETFRSETKTPAFYTAQYVKKQHPDALTVFFSPCVAKRREATENPDIDFVLNYDELGAWFVALRIQVSECDDKKYEVESSAQARNFGITSGVANAVNSLLNNNEKAKAHIINGLDKSAIKDLKKFAKNGKCEFGNLIEVMACQGGCLGGSSTLNNFQQASKQLNEYIKKSKDIKSGVNS